MTAREILHKMKVKAGFSSSPPDTGKGKGKISKHITHGFNLVKGKASHPMEDYLVSEFKQVDDKELGLFAIFDGHMGHDVANYLQSHLFDNILKEPDFWTEPLTAIKRAYDKTDAEILEKALVLGKGGSTAVTAILVNGQTLFVANVGDSRAVICKNGDAVQLSVDHDPGEEKSDIESRGGFVSNIPGDVPRVDGQLAVARAFGDKSLKKHLTSEPDVNMENIDNSVEFLILASDGLWKVMSNQEAVDSIKHIKDAQSAAKSLTEAAISRKSKDDISCIVFFPASTGTSKTEDSRDSKRLSEMIRWKKECIWQTGSQTWLSKGKMKRVTNLVQKPHKAYGISAIRLHTCTSYCTRLLQSHSVEVTRRSRLGKAFSLIQVF